MVKINLRKLNDSRTAFANTTNKFRDHLELPQSVYQQLEGFGVQIHTSFLLDWFPDGFDVFVVKLLLSDGSSMKYTVSPSDPTSSSCVDVTNKFVKSMKRNNQKPWKIENLAWEALRLENTVNTSQS